MANYTPTGTAVTDYSSTTFAVGDTINASFSGAVNPIKLPAGTYKLECQGGTGGIGWPGTVSASTTVSMTQENWRNHFTVISTIDDYRVGTNYFYPYNLGDPSSESGVTLGCINAGTYTITYEYVTEANFDKAYLIVGGVTVLNGVSGTNSGSYTAALSAGSEITMRYTKDGSVDASGECYNVYISYTVAGGGVSINSGYWGGYPGYSYGNLTLKEPTILYLYVGGAGGYSTSSTQGTTTAGGFNGGGSSKVRYYLDTYSSGGGGGGATDIRIGQDNLYARVIVAGGGGGGAGEAGYNTKAGGGLTGGSAYTEYQATQNAPGTNGAFGVGANATGSANYRYGPGGGGGGWYGGGASASVSDSDINYRQMNGGGSGYVYTASTAANYPNGCLLNSLYYLEEASTTANVPNSITNTTDGAIKITFIKKAQTSKIFIKTNSTTWSPVKAMYLKIDNTTWKGGEIE